jgi:hypothetical protein
MPVKSGYSYWKEVAVTHTDDGAQTNYQMKVLVGESSGATGAEVDCGGKCLSTFNDLFFQGYSDIDQDEVVDLDYWIESISGATPNQLATVRVELKYIPAHPNNTVMWMSYSKTGASEASSGANTFGAGNFSNFETGADGDTIADPNTSWTEEAAHVHISTAQKYSGSRSAQFVGSAGTSQAYFPRAVTAGVQAFAINVKVYIETGIYIAYLPIIGNGTKRVIPYVDSSGNVLYYQSTPKDTGKDVSLGAWQQAEVFNINFTAGTFSISINGGAAATGLGMNSDAYSNGLITVANQQSGAGDDYWIDDIFVRNWTANEPTWGAWGAEQSASVKRSVPRIARIMVMSP